MISADTTNILQPGTLVQICSDYVLWSSHTSVMPPCGLLYKNDIIIIVAIIVVPPVILTQVENDHNAGYIAMYVVGRENG